MRPAHLIHPDEVDDWLADSVNQRVTYHRTTREAAESIFAHGVDIERSRTGSYGQGFYTSNDPSALPGDADVPVAIRMLRPLDGDLDTVADEIDSLVRRRYGRVVPITPSVARVIREDLLELGYDGVIVRDGGGDFIDYVVATVSETVRVVSP